METVIRLRRLLFAVAFLCNAVAQAQERTAEVLSPQDVSMSSSRSALLLQQELFSSSPGEARNRVLRSARYVRLSDGLILSAQDIPKPIADSLSFFAATVVPSIEFRDAPLGDVLSFIAAARTTPQPDKDWSIGLLYEGPKVSSNFVPDSVTTKSIEQLPGRNTLISCLLRRVNMIEFIEQLSKAVALDVGFTPDGQIVFGSEGKWGAEDRPSYLMRFSK